jgi:hypothetical protein
MIFGVLAPSQTDPGLRLTLKPPSPYARRLPLSDHPSTFDHPSNILRTVGFASHVKVFSDPVIRARNSPDSPTRTDSTTIGGGGLEWGAWVQFVDEGDRITTPSLAFLADLFAKGTLLLPQNERPGLGVRSVGIVLIS